MSSSTTLIDFVRENHIEPSKYGHYKEKNGYSSRMYYIQAKISSVSKDYSNLSCGCCSSTHISSPNDNNTLEQKLKSMMSSSENEILLSFSIRIKISSEEDKNKVLQMLIDFISSHKGEKYEMFNNIDKGSRLNQNNAEFRKAFKEIEFAQENATKEIKEIIKKYGITSLGGSVDRAEREESIEFWQAEKYFELKPEWYEIYCEGDIEFIFHEKTSLYFMLFET